MKFVRFKAICECLGIRRSSVAYFLMDESNIYDVSTYEHPLNSLKNIKINKACVSFLDYEFDIDHPINFKLKATSLDKEIEEHCHLDIRFIEVKENDLDRIKELFTKRLDPEYAGEFEFIYGFYLLNNNMDASEYFTMSDKLGFRLAKRYIESV